MAQFPTQRPFFGTVDLVVQDHGAIVPRMRLSPVPNTLPGLVHLDEMDLLEGAAPMGRTLS
jgi:hypothetical protein